MGYHGKYYRGYRRTLKKLKREEAARRQAQHDEMRGRMTHEQYIAFLNTGHA